MTQRATGQYETVLFDLDHTLLDSDASIDAAFDATMHSIGVDDAGEVRAVFDRINHALWRGVERGERSPNEVLTLRFRLLLDELDMDADPISMGETFADGLIVHGDLLDGALQLLDTLAGRCQMGLVTNGIGKIQRGRMARLGIEQYFDVVTISGEIGVAKPDAAIFDLTFDALAEPRRDASVMIGDSLGSDILGAQNARIDTIWFNQHDHEPGAEPPTHTVTRLADVGALI